MLLTAGRLNVMQLLGNDADGKPIAQIVVGTSDAPVSEGDTALTGAFAKDVTTVNYLSDGHVQFNTLLEAGDPAMTIKEVGILNADGVLCHRKVVPTTTKVDGLSIAIIYKIKVQ